MGNSRLFFHLIESNQSEEGRRVFDVDTDSLLNDINWDIIYDNYPNLIESFESVNRVRLKSELEQQSLTYIEMCEEEANKLKDTFINLFPKDAISRDVVEVQFYRTLRDVEMQNLDAIIARY